MGDWAEKTVLVTGAAGGMGRAIAARFLEAGARAALSDVNAQALAAASSELACFGGRVHPIVGDVTRVADCEAIVKAAAGFADRLDVVVNSAGVWVEGPSETMTEELWDRAMDVNLKGSFFICRFAIPELEKTGGNIINISSNSGLIGEPEAAIYCASKAGVNLMTRSLAVELAPRGIRVNAVCPGDVQTPMLEGQIRDWSRGDPEGYKKRLLSYYPQGDRARFIRPEEIAATVFFLASPEAEPITGECLAIDFGATAGI